jgi:hypothetical protein
MNRCLSLTLSIQHHGKLSTPYKVQKDTGTDNKQISKAVHTNRTNVQVSAEDLVKAKLSAESLRVATNYMSQPRLLAGICPQKTANWMVSKADEVTSFVSQLQPG